MTARCISWRTPRGIAAASSPTRVILSLHGDCEHSRIEQFLKDRRAAPSGAHRCANATRGPALRRPAGAEPCRRPAGVRPATAQLPQREPHGTVAAACPTTCGGSACGATSNGFPGRSAVGSPPKSCASPSPTIDTGARSRSRPAGDPRNRRRASVKSSRPMIRKSTTAGTDTCSPRSRPREGNYRTRRWRLDSTVETTLFKDSSNVRRRSPAPWATPLTARR